MLLTEDKETFWKVCFKSLIRLGKVMIFKAKRDKSEVRLQNKIGEWKVIEKVMRNERK